MKRHDFDPKCTIYQDESLHKITPEYLQELIDEYNKSKKM